MKNFKLNVRILATLFVVAYIASPCFALPASDAVAGTSFEGTSGQIGHTTRKLLEQICYGEFTDACFNDNPSCCTNVDVNNECDTRVRPIVTCDNSFSLQNVCSRQTTLIARRRLQTPEWSCNRFADIYVSGGSVANDPVMKGFDAKTFLFEELGEFPLLHEGDGWKVNATFSPVPVLKPGVDPKERSFTSEVKVQAPNGDVATCSLPALAPNTTRVKLAARTAGSATTVEVSPANPTVEMEQMKVTGGLTWKTTPSGEWYSYVVACEIETPKMKVKVYQVSGWEEAQAKPEEHGWAAPYTWLNMGFQITETLTAPVTGVLGDTYPKPHLSAGVEGAVDDAGLATARRLLSLSSSPLLAEVNCL